MLPIDGICVTWNLNIHSDVSNDFCFVKLHEKSSKFDYIFYIFHILTIINGDIWASLLCEVFQLKLNQALIAQFEANY